MDNGATKIVKLNTLLNAIDSLETANKSLERKNPLKWKWFAFSIHHSLYQYINFVVKHFITVTIKT
jgi:hypothetical protein